MAESACVVAKDGTFANAETAAAFDVNDAAGFERLGRPFDGLAARGDFQVRAGGRRVVDHRLRTQLELAPVIPGRSAAETTAVGRTL